MRDTNATEEAEAEQALRQSEERYRMLFEGSRDAIYVSDRDGRITEANRAAQELFGCGADDLIGHNARDLYADPEDRRRFQRRMAAEGSLKDYRVRLTRWDGTPIECLITSTVRRGSDGEVDGYHGIIRDITERERAARRLRASEARYRVLFERNVAGVYRTTMDGEILQVNAALAAMLGYESAEDLAGRDAGLFYEAAEERERWLAELRAEGTLTNYEVRLRRQDGTPVWMLENASLVDRPGDGGKGIVGTVTDITERKRLEAQLERMAYRDPLTGLANRRLLREQAERAVALADRQGQRVGILYLDLTRFKRINDTLGHDAGDRVLAAAAKRLRAHLRRSDVAARLGGDEFALLLTELEEPDDALRAAERVMEGLGAPLDVLGHRLEVSAHLGIAVYPDHGANFEELLRNADRTMYRAQARGGGGIEMYRAGTGLPRRDELAMESALRRAVEEDELVLHYQPIYRLASDRLTGAEALLRWEHPDRGLLGAAEFIPLAEKLGMISRLDRWALREAVRQARTWARARGPDWVAVNLSAQSLLDPELVEYVRELIEDEGLEEGRLLVEVTERSAMRDAGTAADTLHGLGDLGVRTAIDDFGTGHAVLAYLKHFPAEFLKIDSVFVQSVEFSAEDRKLAEAVAGLARGLGIQVVAEGVETSGQYDWVKGSGCDFVQGFHTGRPVPPGEIGPGGRPRGATDPEAAEAVEEG